MNDEELLKELLTVVPSQDYVDFMKSLENGEHLKFMGATPIEISKIKELVDNTPIDIGNKFDFMNDLNKLIV